MSRPQRTLTPSAITGAAILLLVSLWVRWYTATEADIELPGKVDGWDWSTVQSTYLVLVAVWAAVTVFAGARGLPIGRVAAEALAVLSALGFVWVLYRVFSPPDPREGFVEEISVSAGPWLALAALGVLGLAAVTFGAEERA